MHLTPNSEETSPRPSSFIYLEQFTKFHALASAYHSPCFSIKVNTSVMDIKKTWEKLPCLSHNLAFALPFHRDKQLSQPTPLGIIYNVHNRMYSTKQVQTMHTGIIHPAWTLRCDIFC